MSDYVYGDCVYDLHYVFIREPDDGVEDLKAYYIGILSAVLGSDEDAEEAYVYDKPDGFFAYFPHDKAHLFQKHPCVVEVIQEHQPPPTNHHQTQLF